MLRTALRLPLLFLFKLIPLCFNLFFQLLWTNPIHLQSKTPPGCCSQPLFITTLLEQQVRGKSLCNVCAVYWLLRLWWWQNKQPWRWSILPRGRWRVIKCPRMLQHMHFNPIVYHKVLAGSLVNPPFAPGGCVPGPGRALSSDWTDD